MRIIAAVLFGTTLHGVSSIFLLLTSILYVQWPGGFGIFTYSVAIPCDSIGLFFCGAFIVGMLNRSPVLIFSNYCTIFLFNF